MKATTVSVNLSGQVGAVGQRRSSPAGACAPLAEHWDGSGWHRQVMSTSECGGARRAGR